MQVASKFKVGQLVTALDCAYVRRPVRYVLMPLTSYPDRNLQDVLTTCVDGYDGYRRSQTFISTTGINDDALWEQLCTVTTMSSTTT